MENKKQLCVRKYRAQIQSKTEGIMFRESTFENFDENFQNYLMMVQRRKDKNLEEMRLAERIMMGEGSNTSDSSDSCQEENLVYGTPEWKRFQEKKVKKE
jgi:hypothetical protein